jgi:hypothetical protein
MLADVWIGINAAMSISAFIDKYSNFIKMTNMKKSEFISRAVMAIAPDGSRVIEHNPHPIVRVIQVRDKGDALLFAAQEIARAIAILVADDISDDEEITVQNADRIVLAVQAFFGENLTNFAASSDCTKHLEQFKRWEEEILLKIQLLLSR